MTDGHADREQHELCGDDATRLTAHRLALAGDATQQPAKELPASAAGAVAHELASQGRPRDWVAAVERDVGFVGTELLAVMRHVTAPVQVDRREGGEAHDPTTDEVVQ